MKNLNEVKAPEGRGLNSDTPESESAWLSDPYYNIEKPLESSACDLNSLNGGVK
jgi:hypothetical protein